MAQRAKRMGIKFWLNGERSEDKALLKWIGQLKKARKFTQTIRDAFWLFYDLTQGNTDALEQLFPAMYKKLTERPDSATEGKTSAIRSDNDALQAQLKHLEKLILQQGATPIETVDRPKLPKQLPDYLDASDLIEVKETPTRRENNNSGYNLIIAATLQNVGHCNGLSAEIRAYGIATKRISKSHLTPENYALALAGGVTKPKSDAQKQPSPPGNPKQIALPKTFKPSTEDDDDDLLFDALN